jgi:uncharacterized protein (TIGR02145 family)
MKKIHLIFILYLSSTFTYSQNSITLFFEARDSINQNLVSLDSVSVQNLTENCDTILFGPNPELTLQISPPVGIEDFSDSHSEELILKQNFPNPFHGSTTVNILREYNGSINLILYDALGRKLSEYTNDFEQGLYSFTITSSELEVLILVVYDDKCYKTIKIISSGQGQKPNEIKFIELTPIYETSKFKSQDNSGFSFSLGNLMLYTAHSNGFNEGLIIDSPETDSIYLFNLNILNVPSVITSPVIDVTQISATCGGEVTSDGGSSVTSRGVCWHTTPNPTLSDNYTSDGTGTGSFISYLTDLTPNTQYYLRAYSTNYIGTGYGNEVVFTSGQSITTPILTTTPVTNISQTSATSGGEVIFDGGIDVTARGVCWSTSPNPTITGSHTSDGTGSGVFISQLTDLSGGTLYFIRAYATNIVGTSYGNELTFTTLSLPNVITTIATNIAQFSATSGGIVTTDGGDFVSARGVCWSLTPNPNITGNHTVDGTGTGTFVSSITGLNEDSLYYYRAYATNSLGTAYGNEYFFSTLTFASVTTTAVVSVTMTSVTSGGNVIDDGGTSVTARGVCFNIAANPTIADFYTIDGAGLGIFISNISGLASGTLYYVRAYATNSIGTSYGNELTFTTLSLPSVTTTEANLITQTTASSGGNVTSDGGAEVTERGVCWSTTQNPTIANTHTSDGTGMGSFISNITALAPNTIYYIRAYATNNAGTAYGNEFNFTTVGQQPCPGIPTVLYDGKTYNTIQIGTQCWFKENLNTGTFIENTQWQDYYNNTIEKYCYNNLESNCEIYGGLYSWDEMMQNNVVEGTKGICPVGWHLPSNTEWTTLSSFLGGNIVAGGKLKETGTLHWNSPNAGATDEYGFTSLPGGHGLPGGPEWFGYINDLGFWWTSSDYIYYFMGSGSTSMSSFNAGYGYDCYSARCIKDILPTLNTTTVSNIAHYSATSGGEIILENNSSVTSRGVCWSTSLYPTITNDHTEDGSGIGVFTSNLTGLLSNTTYYVRAYATNNEGTSYGNQFSFITLKGQPCPGIPSVQYEGKIYNTVLIGTQCWLKENLNVGTRIESTQNQNPANGIIEKYCMFDLESYCDVYGGLYQWNEMMQGSTVPGAQGICPPGWHIPSNPEWVALFNFCGGEEVAGGVLKETGYTHWLYPNWGASDLHGFSALPDGYVNSYPDFNITFGHYWTSTESSTTTAIQWDMENWVPFVQIWSISKLSGGLEVRCIKD